MQNIATTESN